jgi:hypothetical protein
MQERCSHCFWIFVLLVLVALGSSQSWESKPLLAAKQAITIPASFQYAEDFVRILERAGLTVRRLERSHLEGMFDQVDRAVFIVTDRGVIEAAFFPGPADAEKLTISYNRDGAVNRHHYRVQGWPAEFDEQLIDSTYPIYFTLHKNWFIQTLEAELEDTIKNALGQTKPRVPH